MARGVAEDRREGAIAAAIDAIAVAKTLSHNEQGRENHERHALYYKTHCVHHQDGGMLRCGREVAQQLAIVSAVDKALRELVQAIEDRRELAPPLSDVRDALYLRQVPIVPIEGPSRVGGDKVVHI